jgi:hypothetical protein
MVENISVCGEDAVGEPILTDDVPDVLDRLSSGDLAGRGSSQAFLGIVSLVERCQPA